MGSGAAPKLLLFVGGVAFLAGVAATGYNAWFFHKPGPTFRYPVAVGLLLSTILITVSLQLVINARRWKRRADGKVPANEVKMGKCRAAFAYVFAVGIMLESLVSVVFNALAYPWGVLDALVMSSVLLFVSLLNLVAMVKSRSVAKQSLQSAMHMDDMGKSSEYASQHMLKEADDVDFEDQKGSAPKASGGVSGCLKSTARVINRILKALALVFFLLMLLGTSRQGLGYRTHGNNAPGKFYTVAYAQGVQTMHVWCDGPTESQPVIWIESGGGHTMYDIVGLLYLLRDKGHRVCIYDRPGMGLSDYAFPDQDSSFYNNLLLATGEKGPFFLVAWAGGATMVWTYAAKYPENVVGVALMDVYPEDFEFKQWQYVNNKTDEQTAQYKAAQFAQRSFLHDVIRLIGVQLGLTSLIVGGGNGAAFFPPEYFAAYQFINLDTEKSWTTQYYGLMEAFGYLTNDYDVNVVNNTIARDIPLLIMASYQDWAPQCNARQFPLDSAQCQDIRRSVEYGWESKADMVSYTDKGELAKCDPCTLALAVDNQTWIVDTLVDYITRLPSSSNTTLA